MSFKDELFNLDDCSSSPACTNSYLSLNKFRSAGECKVRYTLFPKNIGFLYLTIFSPAILWSHILMLVSSGFELIARWMAVPVKCLIIIFSYTVTCPFIPLFLLFISSYNYEVPLSSCMRFHCPSCIIL